MIRESETPEAAHHAGVVADATRGNWVDRFAPAWSRPYLRLSRADRPIGTWLLLIPCFWAIALAANAAPELGGGFRPLDLWLVVGASLGAFLMRGAGCTWNDITDRHIDGSVARTRSRPIPSGQVSVKQALAWMALQTLISAVILLSFPRLAIVLGVISLVPVLVYPFAKRFTWWPQVFLGLAFNWGALLLWAAHAEQLAIGALLLYVAGINWTLYYDTIYAHQDKEDDALIGVKSTARLFGDNSGAWLAGFMIVTLLLMMAAVIVTIPTSRGITPMVVALLGVWAFGLHMWRQLVRVDLDDPASCLEVFRANRDAGLIPVPFLAVAALL